MCKVKSQLDHFVGECNAFVSVADQAIQCNARCGTRYGAFRSGVDDDFRHPLYLERVNEGLSRALEICRTGQQHEVLTGDLPSTAARSSSKHAISVASHLL